MNMPEDDAATKAALDMIDAVHEMSMSDDPCAAVAGRCLKRFFSQFDDFECEEMARGTHKGVIIGGIAHAMAAMIGVSAYAGAKAGRKDDAKRELIKLITVVINEVFDAQKGSRVEGEKRGQSPNVGSH